mmetsp:Transcript_51984/g.108592  ORF Transcript_51984/g.108592 Transcript_51984/m.108592 type:complete len:129 (-) Transcript_51984:571-957(-)
MRLDIFLKNCFCSCFSTIFLSRGFSLSFIRIVKIPFQGLAICLISISPSWFMYCILLMLCIVFFAYDGRSQVEAQLTCDEHPKELTVAQAATPTTSGPSEARSQLGQHWTLEIFAFNHNDLRCSMQLA